MGIMKRFLKLFLAFAIFIGSIVIPINKSYASNDIKVLLDGKELVFDVPPQIIEGRTLLPLRAIFEALGLEVGWDNETRTITGISEGKEIILKLDSKEAKVNGINKTLDVPAKAINGRTLVPVRFIAESLEMNVVWNQESKTVKISKDNIIEWKYEGYEGTEPFKEYERKYVNGVKSDETRYNGKNHVIQEKKEEKVATNKYPYNLTEKDIKDAIGIGESGFMKAFEYTKNYSLIPNKSDYNLFIEETQLLTPYHLIVRYSAIEASKFNNYSVGKAKELTESLVLGETLNFDIIYLGSKVDSHKGVNIVLKQGNNIFKPFSFSGRDKWGEMTDSWPKFPAYRALLTVSFSNTFKECLL